MPENPSKSLFPVSRLWIAFMGGVLIYGLILILLDANWSPLAAGERASSVRQWIIMIAALIFLLLMGFRRTFTGLTDTSPYSKRDHLSFAARWIVLMGMAESIGLLGLIVFLLTGDRTAGLVLVGLSCLALIMNRPSSTLTSK